MLHALHTKLITKLTRLWLIISLIPQLSQNISQELTLYEIVNSQDYSECEDFKANVELDILGKYADYLDGTANIYPKRYPEYLP